MKTYEFDAVIQGDDKMDIGFVEFPYDVETEFGVKGQVKVKVTFDGYPYRGSLAKMGRPCHFIGLTKAVRQAIAKQPGDTVHVVLQQDTEPRMVVVPEDLAARFNSDGEIKAFFDKLSYTHRKEYVNWITEAKKPETRTLRIEKTMQMLRDKIRHP